MTDIRNLIILLLAGGQIFFFMMHRGQCGLDKGAGGSAMGASAGGGFAWGALDLVVAESGKNNRTPYESYHVKNTITKNMGKVQKCYLGFIEKNPTHAGEGEIFVDWLITPAGQAHEAALVSSSLDNQDLIACITGEINTWKFPPPPSGRPSYSSFTFNFKKTEK